MAVELLVAARTDGITVDEPVYISAGFRHLTALDFRLNPETPPLAKMLAALPLVPLGLRTPAAAGEWGWIDRFFHENSATRIIGLARLPGIFITLLLGLMVWAFGRREHGPAAGLFALALLGFHPSILAHGHLATTDLPSAASFLAASWAFRRWTLHPTAGRAAVVAAALCAAVLTRLTGWLLVPGFAVLALLELRAAPAAERRVLAFAVLRLVALSAVVVPLGIWAAYGFRYAAWPGRSVLEGAAPAPVFPEAYLEGLRFQSAHALEGHRAYLLGELSDTGWRKYYLVAFVVKNTPGFLLALAAAAVVGWRARGRPAAPAAGRVSPAWHWIAPAVLLFLAVSWGRIDIGERYLLPVYPYAILLASSAVPHVRARRAGGWLLFAVLALHAGPSLLAAPRGYLTYFNALAGGASGGHRVLVDSNLDWGQDLPRLKAWMERSGVDVIQLGYHGSDDPERLGLSVQDLPGVHLYPGRPAGRPFHGVVAVSPNLLFGIVEPKGQNPYPALRERPPDERAGIFFIYRLR